MFHDMSIRAGTVCHGSVRTSVRGSRFDTISEQQEKKNRNLLYSVSFNLFWTDIRANYNFFHLDVNIQIINTIITLLCMNEWSHICPGKTAPL